MKRILALTICLLSLLSLAACGAKTAEEPVSLTFTNTLPDDKYAADAIGAFADAVWEATDQTVTVEVREGDEQTALEALRAGTIDMTVLSYETMDQPMISELRAVTLVPGLEPNARNA